MSNEYKDWLADKMETVIMEAKLLDCVTRVDNEYVIGFVGDILIKYHVWLDGEEWKYEKIDNEYLIANDYELGYMHGYHIASANWAQTVRILQNEQNILIGELNNWKEYI